MIGCIFEFCSHRILLPTPQPIFFDIGCIDYHHVFLVFVVIQQKIIDDTSVFIQHAVILCFTYTCSKNIIRSYPLNKLGCFWSFHPKLAHMRHIKNANGIHHRQMFINNSGILDGHVVSRKFVHFCA